MNLKGEPLGMPNLKMCLNLYTILKVKDSSAKFPWNRSVTGNLPPVILSDLYYALLFTLRPVKETNNKQTKKLHCLNFI